jgi:hypothetical protein|tara:strand:- start:1416 stop:2378 length:963 start_codon:yes stop_codon:yes gene_type:complete
MTFTPDIKILNSLIDRKPGSRKRPMFDKEVHKFHNSLHNTMRFDNYKTVTIKDTEDYNIITEQFKEKMHNWVHNHKLISFTGLDAFPDRDICLGVTHQIDELHMMYNKKIVIFDGDYPYHTRLFPSTPIRTVDTLTSGDVLIIATPFTFYDNDVHPDMPAILERCLQLNIPIHIDAAWYPCCRNINFNVDHPAIKTITFSLSKAFGMNVHRIGLRYSRKRENGPIKLMNDFRFISIAEVWIGLEFMQHFGTDFWWRKYEKHYDTIIEKCNLTYSKAIHTARSLDKDGNIIRPVPMRHALLYMEYGIIPNQDLDQPLPYQL